MTRSKLIILIWLIILIVWFLFLYWYMP